MAQRPVGLHSPGALTLLVMLALGLGATAWGESPPSENLRNWYDDPFFPISGGVPACPKPRGPFATEHQFRQQAHRRAENGASCCLAAACEKPSAYADDREIARQLRTSAALGTLSRATSLWVTVQGRIVYVEGCVNSPALQQPIEAMARSSPLVQQVVILVRSDDGAPPPYATMPRGHE